MTNQKSSASKTKQAQRRNQRLQRAYKDAADAQQVLEKSFTKAALGFLNVEVNTGLNLARIATGTYDAAQRARNRFQARQAYDQVLKHLSSVAHAGNKSQDPLHTKIAELRELLISLGEQL